MHRLFLVHYCLDFSYFSKHLFLGAAQTEADPYNLELISDHTVLVFFCLKVSTNEKRDGLSVVSFDRSPFKLFSLKFSNLLVQAPSCESYKTAPRPCFYYLQTIIVSQ
jgi:hypothetical protein